MPLLKVSWQFKLKLHLGDATLGDLPTPARAAVFSFDTTIVITLICVDNKFYAASVSVTAKRVTQLVRLKTLLWLVRQNAPNPLLRLVPSRN
jgi:hypothetical protein